MLIGILYAYVRMGFTAGLLCAADMIKKDLPDESDTGRAS